MRNVTRAGGYLVTFTGLVVLIGWYGGLSALTTVRQGFGSMKPNTALAFVALGVAVALLSRRRLALLLGAAVAALGAVTSVEYLLGRSLGVDLLLPGIDLQGDPPKMAPVTALALLFLGMAVVASTLGWGLVMRGLTLVAFGMSQVALLGYAYDVSELYTIGSPTGTPPQTVACMAVLSVAFLLHDPSAGLVGLVRDEGSAGRMLRGLGLFVLAGPFLIGWLTVSAQDHGWLDTRSGVIALVVSMTAMGCLVSWLAALRLRELDRERDTLAAARDVAKRRQAQYARSLLEAALDPLATISAEGVITDVNAATVKVTGVPRQELVGTDFSSIFTDPGKAAESYQQVFARGSVTDYPLTIRACDGTLTQVLYNASLYRDPGGNVLGVVASARDVTGQRAFERQMLANNVELEHASRMKSEFLATMSHELRTPLNSVIGFSEALKDGLLGEMTASQQEYIGDIFTSGQHLLSLINDILDLSKVEAGMMNLELDQVDVGLLLSNALPIVRKKAAERSIGLGLELDEHLGLAQLDVRKTKQIVYNLLSNAVKFSNEGGRVSLRARLVPRSSVGTIAGPWPVRSFALAGNEFTDFLEICVTDGGIGISQENMARLFAAFTQIDSSLSRRFEGTGLGLAMVKQMTELLGGSVAVASKPDQGTCVAAWIPLRAAAPPASAEHDTVSVETAPAPERAERVALVVEDDEGAANLVRLLLEAEGFAVLRAASAEEALAMAPRQSLDLITVDICLPRIDGWQFIAGIREDAHLGTVPVVAISGAPDGPSVALAGGAITVLQKPVSRSTLKKTLTDMGFHDTQDRTRTVLVVDDDPKAVELIAGFLPTPAYATVRAYGGQEAIVLARRLRPDLILLDLMMPDVSGFDVVHALSSEPTTSGIPTLVITAKQVTASEREALDTGARHALHVIEKAGFNRVDFLAEVRRALPVG